MKKIIAAWLVSIAASSAHAGPLMVVAPDKGAAFIGMAVNRADNGTMILYQIEDTLDPKCPEKIGRVATLLGWKKTKLACWVKKGDTVYFWIDVTKKDENGRMAPNFALKYAAFEMQGDAASLD